MPEATFDIGLSKEKVLLFYRAKKNRIQVTARDGRTLNLPWELLKPYVSTSGIYGSFTIVFDAKGKCERLIPLSRDGTA
ncbi:MAG: DUF2835 domain-containing protein [Luminiphilus sp.]|nr:DUF2835 domain-containing protein [Luminiphilus sp.]